MISMMTTSVVFSLLLHLMWSECDAARADIVVSYERPKPSRRDCQYNGKTYRHGYYNDTNPECISYWCVNGDMDIARLAYKNGSRKSPQLREYQLLENYA
uniref:8.9 kDa family member n=1 Tax=Rhipicephalus zambeziensis TaxID=60191 RepID=A0A224YBD2_9ACAR